MSELINLPPQQLPFSKKNKKWRKAHLDWADSKTFFNYSLVRKSVIHKKINYDLLNGKLHMSDIELMLNPDSIKAGFVPDRIQHYPIMNSKLNVLRGEESRRVFDYRVIVTNPNAISEIENNKKEELLQNLQKLMADTSKSEEEFNQELEKLNDYYTYEWQDMREIRGNAILNHYVKEYNIPLLFNNGFMDAVTVGEEIYQCDIVGGEPVIERLNPLKVRIFKSGYSNKIEDADIIIIEDYWSPGRVIDTYHDVLSKKDIEYIENIPDHIGQASIDSMDNIDERFGYVNNHMVGEEISTDGFYFDPFNLFSDSISNSLLPYDLAGNIKVLRMYWKSRRRIKKVKSYDPETGEEVYNFFPETYIIDKDNGEEEQIFYINEAWEGTKIGTDIYVNMRPRVVQYNRLSNSSRCHFGIIGSIYNLNDSRPFSLVDMMKRYNYFYDVIHDRLNKIMARNWGKLLRLDLAKIPKKWDIEKWMYYAKVNGIAVEDSFKEGNIGAASGKLAGALNNSSSGVIDAEFGNSIQSQINLLEFIKMEMSEVVGITRQREGQISNRETVGGVERATLQSSHITEWLFVIHDDVKRRVLECFLETAKIAFKGRSKKFQYILSDNSMRIMDIDGDEFAEADYGLVVDNSQGTQELAQKLDMLAQAALQNQTLSFSTIMRLYNSSSLAEKQRLVEKDEQAIQARNAQAQQQQMQAQQQIVQLENEQRLAEMQQKEQANIRDNETKIIVAQIQASSKEDGISEPETNEDRANLREKIREFDEKMRLEKEKLSFEREKHSDDVRIKEKSLKKNKNTNSNK
ncbi:portal protein [uncultured phage cr128_1]|uniref:Portal protein n=1 Tax=uncultured phage cr128_1 TaxID=2772076 RepID=A0A7M1RZN1_9CAUD|nr:portal protein [uncultured phage cr128_1]QOR59736.1 portal protein [uncultured phage cr128_1]DAQ75967.1 MAG TPA: portal protein [Bacteriophage sp.]